jgi:hypothetical protein
VALTPIVAGLEAFTLTQGRIPRDVIERVQVDASDLDDSHRTIIAIEEHLVLTDLLDTLALRPVLQTRRVAIATTPGELSTDCGKSSPSARTTCAAWLGRAGVSVGNRERGPSGGRCRIRGDALCEEGRHSSSRSAPGEARVASEMRHSCRASVATDDTPNAHPCRIPGIGGGGGWQGERAARTPADQKEDDVNRTRQRATSLLLALIAAAAFGFGTGTPAGASTSAHGCIVNPLKPYVTYVNGARRIAYSFTIKCNDDVNVRVKQRLMEEDNGKIGDFGWQDDVIAVFGGDSWSASDWSYKPPRDVLKTYTTVWPLADTDNDNVMEVYHDVRFQVCHRTETQYCYNNPKTPQEKSAVLYVSL